MFASMLLSFMLVGAPDVPQAPCDDTRARSDFERTHEELGLVGAAPLYGLEAERAERSPFNASNVRPVTPSGAAPLFGLEEPSARHTPAGVGVAPSR
jgi:hypothetical protein